MAVPTVTPQAGYRCLTVPPLCSMPAREHIWSIGVPSETVGFDRPDERFPLVQSFRSPQLLEKDLQMRVLEELANLSQQVNSLLRGQSTIDKISNVVGYLGELPDEIASLRTDLRDVLRRNCGDRASDPGAITTTQGSPCPKKIKKEAKLQTDPVGRVSMLAGKTVASGDARGSGNSNERDDDATVEGGGKKVLRKHGDGMFGTNHVSVKDAVAEKDYDVRDLYHTEGIMQRIARSEQFASIMMVIIVVNALYIGIEANFNSDDASSGIQSAFIFCDSAFCVSFIFEWVVRFGAFRRKLDCLKDLWFRFDSSLVLLMTGETWLMPLVQQTGGKSSDTKATGLVKLLRLLRLARIGRVLRALPELVAMIKGLRVASRAVGAAFLMLVLLIYVFSIALFIVLKDNKDPLIVQRFAHLDSVMWTILLDGTFLDSPGILIRRLQSLGETIAIIMLLIFILISALTVMNMLIGVLCAVVASVAESEKDSAAYGLVKAQILSLLKELDEDHSGMISSTEIKQVLNNEDALEVLHSLQVEESALLAHLDMFFDSNEDLPFWQIMELILMLRGDTYPSMMHILLSHDFLLWRVDKLITERSLEDTNFEETPKLISRLSASC